MAISLKKMIATVVAGAAALVAVSASADVVLPTAGNGELTLFARDNVTGVVYARGLGVFLDNFATEATTGDPGYTVPTTSQFALPTIGPDANLTSFLAGAAGHEVVWGVQGADTQGSNLPTSPRRLAMTSEADIYATNSIPTTSSLSLAASGVNTFFTSLNANLPDAAGSSIFGAADAGGLWGNTGTAGAGSQTLAGNLNYATVGTAMNFYLFTTNGTSATGGGGSLSRAFQAYDLTLAADGTLSASPVPLPAAAWLLGSGLVGLAGIGRRRRAAVAA